MDFAINEEQTQARKMVSDFTHKEIIPTIGEWDRKQQMNPEFLPRMAELGILGINIPAHWTEFGEHAFRYTYDKIVNQGMQTQWWSYLPILNKTSTLIGTCGYKGAPRNGMVEIGYEVAPAFRGWGLATEIAKGLIANAFKHDEVDLVQAHTLAKENESGSVLKNCRMQKIEEIDDPQDGKIWRWEISKMDFQALQPFN